MKQEDWTQRLRDKLADHEESAPADLWAGIEARLQAEGVLKPSEPETPKARFMSLWGKRIAVAAAFIGVLTCNGYLMWEIGQNEKAKKAEALEASVGSMKSDVLAKNEEKSPISSESTDETPQNDMVTKNVPQRVMSAQPTKLLAQEVTTAQEDIPQNIPEKAEEPIREAVKSPISSEPKAKEPQQVPPSEQDQIRQLDAKIAEATRKSHRGRIGFNLYAQAGSGNQMSANGVMMSPSMAENYNFHDNLLARHSTRSANSEVIYLANYEEQQKHYQPIAFGLTTNIPISSRLSLTTGLVYTRLRSDFVSIMGGIPLTKEQTLHYIGVPVNAQYLLWKWKGLSVYASAGGQADYNVKAKTKQEGVDYPVSRDGLQFSVQGALGIEYDVIPQLGIYVEPGVKHYFDNGSSVKTFFKDKPNSFNLQIGLRLNLGRPKKE